MVTPTHHVAVVQRALWSHQTIHLLSVVLPQLCRAVHTLTGAAILFHHAGLALTTLMSAPVAMSFGILAKSNLEPSCCR